MGSQVIIFKKYCIFSLKIDFVLANSADPDEMPHNAAFNIGLHRLLKYQFWVSGLQRIKIECLVIIYRGYLLFLGEYQIYFIECGEKISIFHECVA